MAFCQHARLLLAIAARAGPLATRSNAIVVPSLN
jgi:hypothetical protein